MREIQLKVLHEEYNAQHKARENAPVITKHRVLHEPDTLKYPDFVELGFQSSTDDKTWTQTEEDAVNEFLVDLFLGKGSISTKCPYYYISHHILNKQKSDKDVRSYIYSKYFRK